MIPFDRIREMMPVCSNGKIPLGQTCLVKVKKDTENGGLGDIILEKDNPFHFIEDEEECTLLLLQLEKEKRIRIIRLRESDYPGVFSRATAADAFLSAISTCERFGEALTEHNIISSLTNIEMDLPY